MRKIIAVILMLISLSISIKASAETNYDVKVINDESSIWEDFDILNLKLEDYYPIFDDTKNESFEQYDNYDKWYVIGLGENYVEETNRIQTYFYLYSPILHQYQNSSDSYYLRNIISMTYKLNGTEEVFSELSFMDSNKEGIIKVKGFSYDYTDMVEIELDNINLYCCVKSKSISASFKALAKHSKEDGFTIKLSFDSTLVIHEMEAVMVEVPKEHANFFNVFADMWEEMWLGSKSLYLTFYNFNFPNSLKPDCIEYAKFRYDLIYRQMTMRNGIITSNVENSQEVIKELEPRTHTFKANGRSTELEFETFVLGNRISKGEFGYLTFTEEQKEKFRYDCSILLESHINTFQVSTLDDYTTFTTSKNTRIENIDFLELWYKKDGILYKCQIATPTIKDPDLIQPEVKQPWYVELWKIMIKIGEAVLKLFHQMAPEFVCGILGSIITVASVILSPFLIGLIIKIIKVPFKIFKIILGG